MRAFLDDLRLAVRTLAMSRGFTAVVVITLGVSIGATTAVYSVVDGVLLRPLPFDRPEQLVRPTWDRTVRTGWPFSPMGLVHLEERSRSYSSFGVHQARPTSVTVVAGSEPRQVQMLSVDAGFWSTLGVALVAGRAFTPEEDVRDGPRVALVSEAFSVEQFGGRGTAVGSTIELNGVPVEIIGVAPASLQYPFPGTDVYISARVDRTSKVVNHSMFVVARLKDGTTPEQADRELEGLVASLPEAGYPAEFARLFTGTGDVPTLRDHLVGPIRRPLVTLLVVSAFVLLIGCVNVANLLLVRGSQRMGQGSVRRALGATSGQLIRYVLSESLVLALAGGLLGIGVAWLGVKSLLALQPTSIPRLDLVSTFSPKVLLYCLGVALSAALFFGAVPAFRMGSVSGAVAVRRGATGGGDRGARHLNQSLVVAQIALGLMVLVGSILLVRSSSAVRSVDKGFDPESRLVFQTSIVGTGIRDPGDVAALHGEVLRVLKDLPDVTGAGATSAVPLTPESSVQAPINPVQDHESAEGEFISRRIRAVSSGYFDAMGIPLLAGRDFEAADHMESARVAIVSERMASEFWPGRDPIGLTILDSIRVVGVVGDIKDLRVTDPEPPIAYFPLWSAPWGANLSFQMFYVVETLRDPVESVSVVRDALRQSAPGVTMYRVSTMEGIVADSIDTFTFAERMMVWAAAMALFLGAVGIYAVLAYSVRRRRGEIGLRMALGATGREVRELILREGLGLAVLGIGLGLVGTAGAARVLSAMLFGVTPFDAATYALAVGIFILVAILACLVPATKAAMVPPAVALRAE